MNDPGPAIDWRRLREFAGVDLCRSYLLSWHVDGDALRIDVDLCLAPEHPFYEVPRPSEQACLRPAIIEFPCCEAIGLDGDEARPAAAAPVAELGLGAIDGLRRFDDGPFELSGEFGVVRIHAERPILRLRET